MATLYPSLILGLNFMGNFFFSWPEHRLYVYVEGVYYVGAFNNRIFLLHENSFVIKTDVQLVIGKPVLPSFLILARNSRWPFIA